MRRLKVSARRSYPANFLAIEQTQAEKAAKTLPHQSRTMKLAQQTNSHFESSNTVAPSSFGPIEILGGNT